VNRLLYDLYHLFPDDLTCHWDCLRRKKHWRSKKVMFIHVPKAAGTSVSHALYGRSLGHFKAREIRQWCPDLFESCYKFAFVRNPWDRAVSAYQFALKGRTETAGMRHKKLYQGAAFRSFEAYVYEWLSAQNLTTLDNVFQPQYLFVTDDQQSLLVDYLGRVEQFADGMNHVSGVTGITMPVLDLNRVTDKGRYVDFYPDDRLINAVGDLYQQDVTLFGYDFK